jgi:saccharopine dehydrogenase-like NADP-dependent oxidoreductase
MSFRTIAPSPGLLDTILWELSDGCETRQVFVNGRFERAGFMEGSRVVEFAEPLGRQRVYYVPHTEVTTLPAHFPSLRFCAVRGTWRPELMDDVRVLNKYGLLDPESIEATKERIWARFGGQRDDSPWRLFVNVEVIAGGTRRTYRASHPDWGQEGTGKMTGICAAVGAQLLARHGSRGGGFIDPEAYFDPREFLGELSKRGTIAVTWEDGEIPL